MTFVTRDSFKLVLDTNTLVRALANSRSASGQVLDLCEHRKVQLLLSRAVIKEYREVMGYEQITQRHVDITPESVELILRRLRYFSEYIGRVNVRFRLDRDRRDEKFIELAIAGNATHIITHDLDILSLAFDHNHPAKQLRQRLPGAKVLTATDFMRTWRSLEN